ncbi:MAG: hypothetical protein DHS20C14_02980 [Phycisphaeraceae bacterium]|nr:MAG: hypothetical protein DHS20C14_02980 [Phycisphaeraceae bacterium]
MSDEGMYELGPEAPVRRPPVPRPEPVALPPAPCPECGYDLRGNDSGRCPECGWRVSQARIRAERERRERKVHEQAWFAPLMILLGGILVVVVSFGYEGYAVGGAGEAAFYLVIGAVQLTVSVVVGWGVFFLLAAWWFGWSHTIPVTMLQVAAAYAGAMGVSAVLALSGVPVLPWLVSCAVLIGLLCRLLDLEANEAVLLALMSWAIKFFVAMFIVNALFFA